MRSPSISASAGSCSSSTTSSSSSTASRPSPRCSPPRLACSSWRRAARRYDSTAEHDYPVPPLAAAAAERRRELRGARGERRRCGSSSRERAPSPQRSSLTDANVDRGRPDLPSGSTACRLRSSSPRPGPTLLSPEPHERARLGQRPRPAHRGRARPAGRGSRRCARRSTGATSCSATRSGRSLPASPSSPGSWTLEASEAVCADGELDVLGVLSALVDENLVRRLGPADLEPRFAMLETIREYASEVLESSGEAKRLSAPSCRTCARDRRGSVGGDLRRRQRRVVVRTSRARARQPPRGARVGGRRGRAGPGGATCDGRALVLGRAWVPD